MVSDAFEIEPPYRDAFLGILSFSSFAAAEETIKRLDGLRRKYLFTGDKRGVQYCRQIALLGRRRAEFIGRNNRVRLQKRLQKQEVANWFRIWLETPDIFDSWLQMRKSNAEFRDLLKSESMARSNRKGRHAANSKAL